MEQRDDEAPAAENRCTERDANVIASLEASGARRHSDEAVLALQAAGRGLEARGHARQQHNPHHLRVLRKHLLSGQPNGRASTSSLDVAAALAATARAGNTTAAAKHEKRHEEMMQRFQIRRLQLPDGGKENRFVSQRNLRRGSLQGPAVDARAQRYLIKDGGLFAPSGSKNGRQGGLLLDTRATVIDMSNAAATNAQPASTAHAAGDDEATTSMRARLLTFCADGASWRWVFIAWKRKLASEWRRARRRLMQPMSPFSPIFRLRMAALGTGLFAYVVSFPLALAFSEGEQAWTRSVDYALEFVSLADFLLMFNTSFLDARNELVTSRRAIASHYLTGWGLLDLSSSLPIHFALDFVSGMRVSWTEPSVVIFDVIPRIVRIAHFLVIVQFIWEARPSGTGKSMWDWLLYSRYSHLLRIGFIICCILVTAHYMACIWKTLSSDPSAPRLQSLYEVYASSFFDALQLLQGQGVSTSSLEQNAFASFAVLVGSIVLAIIFGHVAVLVSNFNANSTNYQRKMESVFAIMTKMQLPAPLRERIHQYYEHLWREYESLDGEIERFSKDLSHTLELEVVLFKYMELVMGVPFWMNCSPDFQKQLALSLRVRVYLPDDFIIRRGEIGDEFYMINHGTCELEAGADTTEQATAPLRKKNASVLSDFAEFMGSKLHPTSSVSRDESEESDSSGGDSDGDSRESGERKSKAKRSIYLTENFDPNEIPQPSTSASKLVKKLTRGQAFGEMALLLNYQRTVNVQAITYVEMCVLHRSDFHQILARHPDDRRLVALCMLTNFIERNEANSVHCPLLETVREVYGEGDPTKTAEITPAFAAEIISGILIPELEDESIRYGITGRLTEQLKAYRNRGLRESTIEPARVSARVSDANSRRESGAGLTPCRNSPRQSNSCQQLPQVTPALLARIESIENTQEQITQCINEMREFMLEMQSARQAERAAEHV